MAAFVVRPTSKLDWASLGPAVDTFESMFEVVEEFCFVREMLGLATKLYCARCSNIEWSVFWAR